jgi:anti-sigma regulatory factor (Ser/Thr protein kinase)
MIRIRNEVSEIRKLAEAIIAFGEKNRLSAEAIFDAHLALEEVVINIISYGFEEGSEHPILVDFRMEGRELILEVQDDAPPFNPLDVPKPDLKKPLEEHELGGLGIFLVRQIMDSVEYRREGGKNILTMRKNIPLEFHQEDLTFY